MAATGAATVASIASYIAQRKLVWGHSFVGFMSTAPIGIPGIVLAVGLFAAYTKQPFVLYGTLWILFLARRVSMPDAPFPPNNKIRWGTTLITGLIWLGSVVILVTGWQPGIYLALELVWALPPIMLQLGFGADILWHYRRLVLPAIVTTTLYLSFADALAISSGTWTIDPAQSLNVFLGRHLPIEEFVFFLLTNTMVTFGMALILADESRRRIPSSLTERLTSLKMLDNSI